jgi:hypothetical protein
MGDAPVLAAKVPCESVTIAAEVMVRLAATAIAGANDE